MYTEIWISYNFHVWWKWFLKNYLKLLKFLLIERPYKTGSRPDLSCWLPWWQTVKNPPAGQQTWVQSLGPENPLEKGTATHSSVLSWRIPWTEEPGSLSAWGLKQSATTKDCHFHLFRICDLLSKRKIRGFPFSPYYNYKMIWNLTTFQLSFSFNIMKT